jgi:hypothetical protein
LVAVTFSAIRSNEATMNKEKRALIEELTIGLGASMMKFAAKIWLKDYPFSEAVVDPVVESLKKHITDFRTQRNAERLFDNLQDEVAHRLHHLIETEFGNLPENEHLAAAHAVNQAFCGANLTRDVLESDIDAMRLVKLLEPQATPFFTGLDRPARELAEVLLRESCNYITTIASKLPDFQLAATRELLRRTTALLAEITQVLDTLVALRRNPDEERNLEVHEFETQYRRSLVSKLDRLDLFGLRLVGSGTRDYNLSVAYVTLSSKETSTNSQTSVDECLGDKDLVLLTGEAGSGKTTLLQWLAVRAAKRDFPGQLAQWNDLMPFFVRLRDYADNTKRFPLLSELVTNFAPNLHEIMPGRWTSQVLAKRALLLIDGVDELPAGRRKAFLKWIIELKNDFEGIKAVVSSRPAAVNSFFIDYGLTLTSALEQFHFKHVVLEPMSLRDSEALIAYWHAAVAREIVSAEQLNELPKWEMSLVSALRDRASIRALASSPLLCAMMCALNWDRRERLPDQRMELYHLALDMLLERRDTERDIPASHKLLDRRAKEELLDSLAYSMLLNGRSEISVEEAENFLMRPLERIPAQVMSTKEVLQILLERSGVLRQPQHGIVDFIHKTFLEYMGARAIVENHHFGFLASKVNEEDWRETIVFAVGHARGQTRDKLLTHLLQRPFLGIGRRNPAADTTIACCLETAGTSLRQDLLRTLEAHSRTVFPPRNFQAARTLKPAAALFPELLTGHHAAPPSTIAACIRTASMIGGEKMLEIIESYATVPNPAVEPELLRAWAGFDELAYERRVLRNRSTVSGIPLEAFDDEAMILLHMFSRRDISDSSKLGLRLADFLDRRALILERQISHKNRLLEGSFSAPISFRDATHIAKIHSLTELQAHEFDPGALQLLQDLPLLTKLSTKVLKEDVLALSNFRALTTLELKLYDHINLRPLGRLRSLTSLSISATKPFDLAKLPVDLPLVQLSVDGASSERLATLKEYKSLEKLRIRFTDDRGIIGGKLHIPLPPSLQELDIDFDVPALQVNFATTSTGVFTGPTAYKPALVIHGSSGPLIICAKGVEVNGH